MRIAKAALALLLFCGLTLGGAWAAGSFVARPVNQEVPAPAAPGRVVHLVASDGVSLTGSYWPGTRPDGPAILMLHGINSSRASFDRHARWLNGLGYTVLTIDFRGHGESGAAPRSFGLHESRDATAALAFLRRGVPNRKVGLIGMSLGGAAALLGEEGPLPFDAMVLQAVYPNLRAAIFNRLAQRVGSWPAAVGEPLLSFQSWPRYGVSPDRFSPTEAIHRYHGPLLVIGGGADRSTTPMETRALFAAAPGPKALWLLAGVGHAETGSVWTEGYRARIRCLFTRSLGEPDAASEPVCA